MSIGMSIGMSICIGAAFCPGSRTRNWPIIPWSSCISRWQWNMYGKVGSVYSDHCSATRTLLPGGV